jgi:hypothetical protein
MWINLTLTESSKTFNVSTLGARREIERIVYVMMFRRLYLIRFDIWIVTLFEIESTQETSGKKHCDHLSQSLDSPLVGHAIAWV